MMNSTEIIKEWNDEADTYNQWESLGEGEKIEFAFFLGMRAARVEADGRNLCGQLKLANLTDEE